MAGWDSITNKILKESKNKEGNTIITDDFLQSALLTALAQESRTLVIILIEHFGFEKMMQLIHLPFPKEMTIYLPDYYEISVPLISEDLLVFLNKCKPTNYAPELS
jgi:hypothetical protein